MKPLAWVYWWTIVGVAVVASGLLLERGSEPTTGDLLSLALLAAGAAVAHFFVVETPRNQSYHMTMALLVAAVVVLPPALFVLLSVLFHLPEWVKRRYPLYIQTFNIANYTICMLGGWVVMKAFSSLDVELPAATLFAMAGLCAAALMVLTNHIILSGMLGFARGHTWRQTGLFTPENLSTDLVFALLGVGVAYLWIEAPWLVPFALAPLILVHRSLAVPQLEAEARVDPKTGLFNARYFSTALRDEIDKASRSGATFSLLMIDLDLLREINNTYGHLAGDAVLEGIGQIFRRTSRPDDVVARFGGEEFAVLLPDTSTVEAMTVAERVRAAVAAGRYAAATVDAELRATVSIGVASFPTHAQDASGLVHEADLAVYRAKIQGRNRVVEAGADPTAGQLAVEQVQPLAAPPPPLADLAETPLTVMADLGAGGLPDLGLEHPVAESERGVRLAEPRLRVAALVSGWAGIAAGVAALALDLPRDPVGLLAILLLVGAGQVLALRAETGSISVSAVGALIGVAMFGPGAALPLALASVGVDVMLRQPRMYKEVFNTGILTVAALGASTPFLLDHNLAHKVTFTMLGLVAGGAYFLCNTGLLAVMIGLQDGIRPLVAWRRQYLWLAPHYVGYGLVAAVVAIAYSKIEIYALIAFTVPLALMRASQLAYIRHTSQASEDLREAAQTIRLQNVSLSESNQLLRQRSMSALEGLTATVDARDTYTAGHSRRVQTLALAIGREVGMSEAELQVLGYAGLFHDIGKLAIPDAILLKPGALGEHEMAAMRQHAVEGAAIVSRLGFLADAVPAVRHHHERFDGSGYPDGLAGRDIPLGARVIHVADALDSMLTTRVYRPGMPLEEAIAELRRESGTQFCPMCVEAALRVLEQQASAGDDFPLLGRVA